MSSGKTTHKTFYTQTLLHMVLLHKHTLTHRRFDTQKPLHTNAFYTQTLLHREGFYTQAPLHTHTDAFIRRCLYTHTHFHAQTLLHTEAFIHRGFYTAFTHRSFYTQTLLHTDIFTHRSFYTHKHTEALQQLRASHQQRTLFWSATSSRQICSHRAKDLSPGMCNSPVVKR